MKTVIIAAAVAGVACLSLGACGKKAAAPVPAASPAAAAPAASTSGRVRGTAETVSADAVGIKTYDAQSVTVPLGKKTGYALVVPSSLATLKTGDFIGTATTGPDSNLKAVELVIFPEAMRGAGEGHYGWDVPGVVASTHTGQAATTSGMTNGVVTQSGMTNGVVAQSGMTNGAVTAGAAGAESTHLTVTYKGGTSQIFVPAGIPVVRLEPTNMAALKTGQKLFVVLSPDNGGRSPAVFVAIGKDGLVPPM